MEETILVAPPEYKLYKPNRLYVATFLGGPLTAGYMIAENYRMLGERTKVWKTWITTIIATVLIFGIATLITAARNIPNYIFPLFYALLASFLVKRLQGDQIKLHLENQGEFYSVWRGLLVALICAIVTFALLILFLYIFDPELFQHIA